MIFRRIIAGFLVAVFAITALFSFASFALSNTFFKEEFYQGKFSRPAYEFLVSFTVDALSEKDAFMASYFTDADLRGEIMTVFPETLFSKLLQQMTLEVKAWSEHPVTPLTLPLGTYRESLLTLAHNLSYRVFESLPECQEAQVPEIGENNLPTCIPAGAEYNVVAAPFSEQFERAVYSAVPEQIDIDLTGDMARGESSGFSPSTLSVLFLSMESIKLGTYGVLLFLIVAIALILLRPFALILFFEGLAFLLSGLLGIVTGFALMSVKISSFQGVSSSALQTHVYDFTGSLFGILGAEVQKAAWIFLALGAVILLTRLYLKYR